MFTLYNFSTFCLVDRVGTCVVVSVFNLAEGKGVIIGNSVAIPEPYVTDVHFTYKDKVRGVLLLQLNNYTFMFYRNINSE